jgi:hypothetical protein
MTIRPRAPPYRGTRAGESALARPMSGTSLATPTVHGTHVQATRTFTGNSRPRSSRCEAPNASTGRCVYVRAATRKGLERSRSVAVARRPLLAAHFQY